MNVYEMEGFLRGKCMPRDILVNESTAEYLVRKLNKATAVKAECDALLMENVRMKDAITTHSQSTHFCELCGRDDPCNTDDACYALNETPATSAALAAIEARGVEKSLAVVSACRENICPGGFSENRQYEESIVQPHLDGIADELENLIIELREAK